MVGMKKPNDHAELTKNPLPYLVTPVWYSKHGDCEVILGEVCDFISLLYSDDSYMVLYCRGQGQETNLEM